MIVCLPGSETMGTGMTTMPRVWVRVIHEKSNFKFLTSSSVILFIKVIKYIMQNFSKFEKSLDGATSVSNFVRKVNEIL